MGVPKAGTDKAERRRKELLRMKELGQLCEVEGRYEFRYGDLNLIVRGDHPEWVLQAACEVLAKTARLETESKIDELTSLVEFEAANEIEVDAAKYALRERFEIIPQCIVSMGRMDYRWAAEEARRKLDPEFGTQPIKRIHDMSLTMNDSFLANEPGVDLSE
jgi:hypothetical protein